MKKITALVITICLLMPNIFIQTIGAQNENEIIHSGKSGNLDWSIDSEGLLLITGVGDYYDREWLSYSEEIYSAKVNVSEITDTTYMFNGCSNLTKIDLSGLDTRDVTNMCLMFADCSGLTELDLSNFDTGNVTDMSSMFAYCSGLTELDLSNFDTGNVTQMCDMFSLCSSLTELNVSSFDTGKVTDMGGMYGMFAGCSNLTELDVSSFDIEKVTDMRGMFRGCTGLTKLDLSGFDAQNVTRMNYMIAECPNLSVINTPKNVNCLCELPYGGTWKDSEETVYTEFPQGISYSVELLKEEPEETKQIETEQTETKQINTEQSVWKSRFGRDIGWFEGAEGRLSNVSETGWRADLSMVGWGGIYGAQVSKEIQIEPNKQYTLHFKLQSTDVNKYVYITIPDEQNFSVFSDWVYLPIGEETELSITFTASTFTASRIIFAFGGDFGDRILVDSDADYRYSLLGPDYQELLANDANGDASAATSIICSAFSLQETGKATEKETVTVSTPTTIEQAGKENPQTDKKTIQAPKKANIKKITRGKKKVSLTLKKVKGVNGYLIQYSTNRKFRKAKKKYTTSIKAVIRKLKSKKTYYFRIKAYKLNGKKKIFSKKWSSVKKVKMK